MGISWRIALVVYAATLVAVPLAAVAQDDDFDAEQQAIIAAMQEFDESLNRQSGAITLGQDLATITVPDNYYFLDSGDARRVLVEAWGNPPEGADVLGMLFPEKYSPFDAESWAVTIEYVEDGYVSDEDASQIDYDDLLRDMRSETDRSNDARREAGYETVDLLGWAEPPHYDAIRKKLYWAKELRFGEAEDSILNYDIRALGRKGVLSMTFIAAADQLAEINRSRDSVIAMVEFNEGMRYEDFDSSIDKVAAYGIGALVAGKVAAKAGIFAGLLIFLKKFGVLLLIGIAALGKKIIGLFSGKKAEEPGKQE